MAPLASVVAMVSPCRLGREYVSFDVQALFGPTLGATT